jgi:hypothetical protein
MSDDEYNWEEYYQKIQGRAPRQLLLDVLEKYPADASLHAIDLGCWAMGIINTTPLLWEQNDEKSINLK